MTGNGGVECVGGQGKVCCIHATLCMVLNFFFFTFSLLRESSSQQPCISTFSHKEYFPVDIYNHPSGRNHHRYTPYTKVFGCGFFSLFLFSFCGCPRLSPTPDKAATSSLTPNPHRPTVSASYLPICSVLVTSSEDNGGPQFPDEPGDHRGRASGP
jgi:hypothetical protein